MLPMQTAVMSREVSFTVLSGDGGFQEVHSQYSKTREVHVIDPHLKDIDFLFTQLVSIAVK